jgi:SAM-dependent methyltransferase
MLETWVPNSLHNDIAKFIGKYDLKAARYLDMGCGEGKLSSLIAEVVKPFDGKQEVYGADATEQLLKKLPTNITGVRADLNQDTLPFSDGYFDLVTATEVIEHLHNTDNLLDEAYRVLKPNGYFLVTSPNLASWLNRFLLLSGFQPYNTEPSVRFNVGFPTSNKFKSKYSGHLNLFTLRALEDLLSYHGFDIIATSGSAIVYSVRLMTVVDKLLYRRASLASAVMILTQKRSIS